MSDIQSDKFVEAEGTVHLLSAINGEFTLCGDAFDLGDGVEQNYEWKRTKSRTVTCPRCARQIVDCRGVRVLVKNREAQ